MEDTSQNLKNAKRAIGYHARNDCLIKRLPAFLRDFHLLVWCFASNTQYFGLDFSSSEMPWSNDMRTGRPAALIELSDEEHIDLLRRSRQRKGPAESRIRAEIILACAGGESGTSIGHRLGIGVHTVSRWRVRFSRLRLDGLNDEPRSGRPRSITDEQVQAVVNQVLQSKPEDASHWSTHSMSQATGISPASCGYGMPSDSSLTWKRLSSVRPILCSSTRFTILLGFISTRPTRLWYSVSTRKARFRS